MGVTSTPEWAETTPLIDPCFAMVEMDMPGLGIKTVNMNEGEIARWRWAHPSVPSYEVETSAQMIEGLEDLFNLHKAAVTAHFSAFSSDTEETFYGWSGQSDSLTFTGDLFTSLGHAHIDFGNVEVEVSRDASGDLVVSYVNVIAASIDDLYDWSLWAYPEFGTWQAWASPSATAGPGVTFRPLIELEKEFVSGIAGYKF
jgi:hypothetical protein